MSNLPSPIPTTKDTTPLLATMNQQRLDTTPSKPQDDDDEEQLPDTQAENYLQAMDPLFETEAQAMDSASTNSSCWCCPIGNCLFGGIISSGGGGNHPLPWRMRSLECIAKFLFWCSGMYADEIKSTTTDGKEKTHFRRYRWDMITQLNETRPITVNGVRATDMDVTSLVSPNVKIPIRIYEQILPETDKKTRSPIMMFIHGGGFCIGSRATRNHDELCRRYVAEAGFVVISISYRLAPEFPFPTAVHDCYDVLRWIHDPSRSGTALPSRCDRLRIVLAGDSAGGNLACVLASLVRDGVDSNLCNNSLYIHISHLLLLYPVLFLPGISRVSGSREFLTQKMSNWFIKSYLPFLATASDPAKMIDELQHTERRLNPFVAGCDNLPAVTIVSAEYDGLVHENRAAAEMLHKADVPCVLRPYAHVQHGFATFSFLPEADRCFQDTLRDLQHVILSERLSIVVYPLPKVGDMITTYYGRGRVTNSNEKDGLRVALEWSLACGAQAVAHVSSDSVRGILYLKQAKFPVGSVVNVKWLGKAQVKNFRTSDGVYELDLGWGLGYVSDEGCMVV